VSKKSHYRPFPKEFVDDSVIDLAACLALDPQAIEEAIRRGLLSFVKHRKCRSWRFGDSRNASFRRVDGEPFRISGESVKAEAETCGESWHHLIGLDDVIQKDRREILLLPEGSKDALAALHFANAEGTLSRVGVAVGLGTGIKPRTEELGKFRKRRVRIIGDVDESGVRKAAEIGIQLTSIAAEVQIFSLAGLKRVDGALVKDLFDLTRIDYDDFEANRDLWSVTDLDSKGERVRVITDNQEFFPSPPPPPHVSPESHEFPVYPVSKSQELAKELEELAAGNACTDLGTARQRRWKLERDLLAVQKRISRKLNSDELIKSFDNWHRASQAHLDPKKTRDDYLAAFLGELGKVRVPTGGGEALKKALEHVLTLTICELPVLPGIVDAPESWRRLAALHRELARQSANRTYFLSCRDAAKAHPTLNKDSANNISRALNQLGVIKLVRIGTARLGGNASEFRYLLPAELNRKQAGLILPSRQWNGDPGDVRLGI
jgi:hypothetical protein